MKEEMKRRAKAGEGKILIPGNIAFICKVILRIFKIKFSQF
jgi:hypothetical protein